MRTPPLLEICVGDAESLAAAIAGGADRIELCAALELGGLSPSPGLLALAARTAAVPVYAMIRPRGGDFVFGGDELAAMLGDIAAVRAAGLAGVVLGAALPDGGLDRRCLEALVTASAGLGRTLHRAFDLAPDPEEAIETAIALGFERILTSGGRARAVEGIDALLRADAAAAGRITIMPGAGITAATVGRLLERMTPREVHASCRVDVAPSGEGRGVALGFGAARQVTDAGAVGLLKAEIRAWSKVG